MLLKPNKPVEYLLLSSQRKGSPHCTEKCCFCIAANGFCHFLFSLSAPLNVSCAFVCVGTEAYL